MREARADASIRWALYAGLGSLAAAALALVLLDPLHEGASRERLRYLSGLVANVGSTLLAGVLLAVALHARQHGRTLLLFAFAVAGWSLGDWTWFAYNLAGEDVPYPSLADLAYLQFNLFASVGLLLLLLSKRRSARGFDWLMLVLVPAVVSVGIYASVIEGRIDPAAEPTRLALDILYPAWDAVYVSLAVLALWFGAPAAEARGLRAIAAALALVAAGDVAFVFATDDASYFTGNWIDLMYIAAFALFVHGALRVADAPHGLQTSASGTRASAE